MKLFILGLVLGLSLASLGVWADGRARDTWSQRQERKALEFPVDEYGTVHDNVGGSLTPNSRSHRGPC